MLFSKTGRNRAADNGALHYLSVSKSPACGSFLESAGSEMSSSIFLTFAWVAIEELEKGS